MLHLLADISRKAIKRIQADLQRLGRDIRGKVKDYKEKAWQKKDNPMGSSHPVFLFGCQRSGTNMITKALAKSKQVEFYNEDNPLAYNECKLLDHAIIDQLIQESHARVVLFKPIMDTYRADQLLESFPNVRALYIFRHFDDVVNSIMREGRVLSAVATHFEFWQSFTSSITQNKIHEMRIKETQFESLASIVWYIQNAFYFDLSLNNNPKVKLINYEEIVQQPSPAIHDICDFINLEYNPILIEGISQTSINKNPKPNINPLVRRKCEELWLELSAYL